MPFSIKDLNRVSLLFLASRFLRDAIRWMQMATHLSGQVWRDPRGQMIIATQVQAPQLLEATQPQIAVLG